MKNLTRRDFLKIIGTLGISFPITSWIEKGNLVENSKQHQYTHNVIILVFDSLSARHMSLFGYKRETTPNINHFAQVSKVYHRHYASGNFTIPSTASFFTGTYPWTHRAFHLDGSPLEFFKNNNFLSSMDGNLRKTTAYTHNPSAYYILDSLKDNIDQLISTDTLITYNLNSIDFLFKNDFRVGNLASRNWLNGKNQISNSVFFSPFISIKNAIASQNIHHQFKEEFPEGLTEIFKGYFYQLEDAIDFIYQIVTDSTDPQLYYFHLYPPHMPYKPRYDFLDQFNNDGIKNHEKPDHFFTDHKDRSELEKLQQRYDEFVAYADSEFGRLYNLFKQNGVLNSSYIILTSDHGELFERGIHGHLTPTLYESLVHIPLIIHTPGQRQGLDINTLTSTVDVAPSLVNISGQPIPDWIEGKILPGLGGNEDSSRSIFVVEAKENHKKRALQKASLCIIRWPYKFIHYQGYPNHEDEDELYNLENDPEELVDLSESQPEILLELKDELITNLHSAEEKALSRM